jgi:hypothetical protein
MFRIRRSRNQVVVVDSSRVVDSSGRVVAEATRSRSRVAAAVVATRSRSRAAAVVAVARSRAADDNPRKIQI